MKEVKKSEDHIEVICNNVHNSVYGVLWPPLGVSTFFMALFCFEMAFDSAADVPNVAGAIVMMVLSLASFPILIGTFFVCKKYYEERIESAIAERVDEELKLDEVKQENQASREGPQIEMRADETKTSVANPLHKSKVPSAPSQVLEEGMKKEAEVEQSFGVGGAKSEEVEGKGLER